MNEMDFLFEKETPMVETIGALELKIARLEQRLQVIKQRQRLSRPYPAHEASLVREYGQIEAILHELIWRRQKFLLQTPLVI